MLPCVQSRAPFRSWRDRSSIYRAALLFQPTVSPRSAVSQNCGEPGS